MTSTVDLEGFERTSFSALGETRTVYMRGAGPPVVVMHEVPGIYPAVEAFARRLADAGFRVAMPHLFGTPGRAFSAHYSAGSMLHCCISREFHVLAKRRASPVTAWLRALCRDLHEASGGKGVGAIGMCITGNFALALMVDPWLMAPVLSQPGLPFPVTRHHKRALHLSDDDLATVKRRTSDEGVTVLGLRFTQDPICPKERFARLRDELGDAFEGIEIPSGKGSDPPMPATAHSVVTRDLVDEEGHPTRAALERVLSFFEERLR
ncbi:MAG: dienelactone hydrolase family protein [Sandaracinaceae bacterium]